MKILELQEENERLHTRHQEALAGAEQHDAAIQAMEARMESQYSELSAKVEKLEAQQQSLVPAKQTTISNNTINNTININVYAFEDTPLPKKKDVMPLLKEPQQALPRYFHRKHLLDPRARNIKLVGDDKMSIYSTDRSGVRKWTTRDRKPMLTEIVERLIDDLTHTFATPRDDGWKQWKAYCSDEGLTYSNPEEMEAFIEAERQIEGQLAKVV